MKLWWHKFSAWFRKLTQRRHLESELADELAFHLEMQEATYQEQGLSQKEAQRKARRELGHMDRVKESSRDQRRFGLFEDSLRNLRQAMRSLRLLRRFYRSGDPHSRPQHRDDRPHPDVLQRHPRKRSALAAI